MRAHEKLLGVAIVVGVLTVLASCAAEPQVDVKIYKHTESGNLIYCETGTLNLEFHTYEGEGQIGESKAVSC